MTTTTTDFQRSITVTISPEETFQKINKVSDWWCTHFERHSEKVNDSFTVHFNETYATFTITEMVPNKKIVWLVTDCNLHWLKNRKEWKNTKIIFELQSENEGTTIHFTHEGLVPEMECYDNCSKGWTFYITESLKKYLTDGKGLPDTPQNARANATANK